MFSLRLPRPWTAAALPEQCKTARSKGGWPEPRPCGPAPRPAAPTSHRDGAKCRHRSATPIRTPRSVGRSRCGARPSATPRRNTMAQTPRGSPAAPAGLAARVPGAAPPRDGTRRLQHATGAKVTRARAHAHVNGQYIVHSAWHIAAMT